MVLKSHGFILTVAILTMNSERNMIRVSHLFIVTASINDRSKACVQNVN